MKPNRASRPVGALSGYALAFAAAAAGVMPLGAAPIAIPNPGFENRAITEDGDNKYNKWADTEDVWR